MEELAEGTNADDGPATLRVLRDRAVAASLSAFGEGAGVGNVAGRVEGGEQVEVDAVSAIVGEVADFPSEESLQAAMAAVEALESSVRLAASLRAKLPGLPGEQMLEELLSE